MPKKYKEEYSIHLSLVRQLISYNPKAKQFHKAAFFEQLSIQNNVKALKCIK